MTVTVVTELGMTHNMLPTKMTKLTKCTKVCKQFQ